MLQPTIKSNVVDGHFITYVGGELIAGEFAPQFDHQREGRDYAMGTLTSGYRFKTLAEADAAAVRVIAFWNEHGMFPNVCEAY